MKSKLAATAACFVTLLVLALPAHATSSGELIGIYTGNDSVDSLLADAGLVVTELAKVDVPDTMMDGLEISNLLTNDEGEPLSGEWSYAGPEIANIIVLKADGWYAVYAFNDGFNAGKWDVSDIQDFGGGNWTLSHITAYNVVPIPAAVWLFASGLLGLVFTRRKS